MISRHSTNRRRHHLMMMSCVVLLLDDDDFINSKCIVHEVKGKLWKMRFLFLSISSRQQLHVRSSSTSSNKIQYCDYSGRLFVQILILLQFILDFPNALYVPPVRTVPGLCVFTLRFL